ncbi:bolA-like protein 3 [Dysidea avara]|uniref:bolA-like protein 3 n=1 Tax=Dysidea avara TaxID=196820 RepID=UPI0033336AD8
MFVEILEKISRMNSVSRRIWTLKKYPLYWRWFNSSSALSSPTEEENKIVKILQDKVLASTVNVEDMSGGCGQAYSITVESEMFRGKRILKQHQLVNDALKDVIGSIHAVTIQTSVPTK